MRPDSVIKRVCEGWLKDARAAAERAKSLRDAAWIADLYAGEETKKLRGVFEDSKLRALRALECAGDKEFEGETRKAFEELGKIFAEKKDGES